MSVDIDALATVLATDAWPASRCREVFQRYFAVAADLSASEDDRKSMAAIAAAAKSERPSELRPMLRRIFELIDWSDVQYGDNHAPRPRHVLAQIASRSHQWRGQWLALNVTDLIQMVNILDVPVDARAEWAFDVACALEWGDEEPTRKIAARLATLPPPSPVESHAPLAYDSSDEVEVRTFALAMSMLPDDEARIRFVLQPGSHYGSNPARAAASYLVSRGCPAPVLKAAVEPRSTPASWANFIAVVRQSFPAIADEVTEAALLRNDTYTRTLKAICAALADESEEGEKSRWRIGLVVAQHSGKPTAGKWTFTRLDDLDAAKAVFAGQKPPKKKKAK